MNNVHAPSSRLSMASSIGLASASLPVIGDFKICFVHVVSQKSGMLGLTCCFESWFGLPEQNTASEGFRAGQSSAETLDALVSAARKQLQCLDH